MRSLRRDGSSIHRTVAAFSNAERISVYVDLGCKTPAFPTSIRIVCRCSTALSK